MSGLSLNLRANNIDRLITKCIECIKFERIKQYDYKLPDYIISIKFERKPVLLPLKTTP